MALYLGGSNGKSVKAQTIYVGGTNGKSHKVQKIYIGDSSGKSRLAFNTAVFSHIYMQPLYVGLGRADSSPIIDSGLSGILDTRDYSQISSYGAIIPDSANKSFSLEVLPGKEIWCGYIMKVAYTDGSTEDLADYLSRTGNTVTASCDLLTDTLASAPSNPDNCIETVLINVGYQKWSATSEHHYQRGYPSSYSWVWQNDIGDSVYGIGFGVGVANPTDKTIVQSVSSIYLTIRWSIVPIFEDIDIVFGSFT